MMAIEHLNAQLTELKENLLDQAIDSALHGYQFADLRSRSDMHKLVRSQVRSGSGGSIIVPGAKPFDEFVAEQYADRPALHPEAAGPAPVTDQALPAPSPPDTSSRRRTEIESTKPGMTKEEKARAWAEILRAARE